MGGVLSSEDPKPDLTKYVTNEQINSKNYINKDVNDLTNYYTKNYINTNYITNDNFNTKFSTLNTYKKDEIDTTFNKYQLKGDYALNTDLSNYQTKGDYSLKTELSNYQTKGDYALKTELPNMTNYQIKGDYALKTELPNMTNYQTKGDYALKTELPNMTNYQTKGDYALKTELPNVTNYQTKGNYMSYSGQNKDIFDLENEYLTIRDKNKKTIMILGDSTNINNNTYFNGEINIGSEGNYMNLKKDTLNDCLILSSVKNSISTPVTKWCVSPITTIISSKQTNDQIPLPMPTSSSTFGPTEGSSSSYPSNIAIPISSDIPTSTHPQIPQFYNSLENFVNIIPNYIKNVNWKTSQPFFNRFEDETMYTTSKISTTSDNYIISITIDSSSMLNLDFTYLVIFFSVITNNCNLQITSSYNLSPELSKNILDETITDTVSKKLKSNINIKEHSSTSKNIPIYAFKTRLTELKLKGNFLTFNLTSLDKSTLSDLRLCDIIGSNIL